MTVQGALTDVASALNHCPAIAGKMTVVWIGGAPYPQGGKEFNLMQDLVAARAVFGSNVALWQLPVSVYGTVEVTMAEMVLKIRPCGGAGRYLPGGGRAVRVYDSVDVRFLLEDFFAKLALCYGPGADRS